MTSLRTTKGRDPRPAGFTLAELMLVLVLAVMLAALAAPALTGTMARARLDAAAEEVRTAWANARLEAIRTGESVAFQARLATGEYTLSKLGDSGAALAGSTELADQQRLADDDHEDLGEITFVQLSVGDPADPSIDPSVAECVVFRPDGATDDAFALLQSPDGRQRRVTLRGFTGGTTVDEVLAGEEAP